MFASVYIAHPGINKALLFTPKNVDKKGSNCLTSKNGKKELKIILILHANREREREREKTKYLKN
jgi:hypothetical protein